MASRPTIRDDIRNPKRFDPDICFSLKIIVNNRKPLPMLKSNQ